MKMRGLYPPYIAREDRVTGRLNLIMIGYTIGITKITESSISKHIFLDRQGSSRSLARHADLCRREMLSIYALGENALRATRRAATITINDLVVSKLVGS